MFVLVLNCGSSSVKFQLIETSLKVIEQDADRRIAKGSVERIGGQALLNWQVEGAEPVQETAPVRDHRTAIDRIMQWLKSDNAGTSLPHPDVVGHRVVHGGEEFKDSQRITVEVMRGIEACVPFAPLHNPANIKGIKAVQNIFGMDFPQVAVFDTAFHATMPEAAFLYGIPYPLYRRHKIRRYGFHGTSHRFVSYRYRKMLSLDRTAVNIISLHLGNGCSACAIKGGFSIDTSMGMTPLEGLMMGTRSGDLDPSIVELLMQGEGMSVAEVDALLNRHSGLLGISGLTSDMRDLLRERRENKDRRAELAIRMFCLRVTKYIGAYLAEMGGADALVFTGGVGENSAEIRQEICSSLGYAGLAIDTAANGKSSQNGPFAISTADSRLKAYVIPTDEELLIARDSVRLLES